MQGVSNMHCLLSLFSFCFLWGEHCRATKCSLTQYAPSSILCMEHFVALQSMTVFWKKPQTNKNTFWEGFVLISFSTILTATATVSVSTYQTTTSTTTTVAPPGYDWFSDTNNAILFGSVMAFTAILSGKAGILKLHSL